MRQAISKICQIIFSLVYETVRKGFEILEANLEQVKKDFSLTSMISISIMGSRVVVVFEKTRNPLPMMNYLQRKLRSAISLSPPLLQLLSHRLCTSILFRLLRVANKTEYLRLPVRKRKRLPRIKQSDERGLFQIYPLFKAFLNNGIPT